jgi:hypothetical protein
VRQADIHWQGADERHRLEWLRLRITGAALVENAEYRKG